jgi:DNA-binding CsgD family transcriptional regulator
MPQRGKVISPARHVDLLDIIERVYDLDLPDEEWLSSILGAAAPALDSGRGVLAYFYDAAHRPLRTWGFVGEYAPSNQDLIDVVNSADDEYVQQSYLVVPFATASERPGFDRQRTWGRRLHKHGIRDAIVINGFDQSGLGAWIGAFLPEKSVVAEVDRERWSKVASHVAAGLRLRRRVEKRSGAVTTAPDAVLSVKGRLEHAVEGVAAERENLAEAVHRLERARGRLRRSDPAAAVDAWKVLVRGRWSLVDEHERGGRRYILAYRNTPASPGPEALTEREREILSLAVLGHAPKLIAYELGLAASTVRVHLTNASRKLGVQTRTALITKYRAWLLRQGS